MEISKHLSDAAMDISIALSKLSDKRPWSQNLWIGSWREYKDIAQLLVKTLALADKIGKYEERL